MIILVIPIMLTIGIMVHSFMLNSREYISQKNIYKRLYRILENENKKYTTRRYAWVKGYQDLWIELIKL